MECSDALAFVDKWADLIRKKANIYSYFAPYDEDDCIQVAYMAAVESWQVCQNCPDTIFKNLFWDTFRHHIEDMVPYHSNGASVDLHGFWNDENELECRPLSSENRLKTMMAELGLSMSQLERDLDVTRQTVARWLLGLRKIDSNVVEKIKRQYKLVDGWWESGEGKVSHLISSTTGKEFRAPNWKTAEHRSHRATASTSLSRLDHVYGCDLNEFTVLSPQQHPGRADLVERIYLSLRPYLSPRENETMILRLGLTELGYLSTTETADNLGMHRRVVDVNERRALNKLKLLLEKGIIKAEQFCDVEGECEHLSSAKAKIVSIRSVTSKPKDKVLTE